MECSSFLEGNQMKPQAFKLLPTIWFACVTSLAVALPEDLPAKNEPYPEFRLTGYDMSYCDPLPKQQKKNGKQTKIYWVNDMSEPVVIVWLWADGSTDLSQGLCRKRVTTCVLREPKQWPSSRRKGSSASLLAPLKPGRWQAVGYDRPTCLLNKS